MSIEKNHVHGESCGHTAIKHEDHVDYLVNGHLQSDSKEEHKISVDGKNPAECTQGHECSGHEKGHVHGPDCGHEAVPHGDHIDYLVDGHLHHQHDGHCDNHGPIEVIKK
ncbi:hypothetical protein [Acinetobacter nectaris]|uniref:hypothetical protein n=1 Tax=Acinetobacter nectaris TaxID=1219382 RepID=UPI001F2CF033|nr:hypothetical protein [Acinetobacter nectaris]MCF8998616.1 hypothetical protein [Acinetobacter nectaris]MCF9027730.1 hypothetical protein [Acinetobacter nectaris]